MKGCAFNMQTSQREREKKQLNENIISADSWAERERRHL